ncbi:MAG: formylglycine-generating enzyme family protein [Pirellulaceae bacterium]
MPHVRATAMHTILAVSFAIAWLAPLALLVANDGIVKLAGVRKSISVNGVSFHFRWCPPGEFVMGWPEYVIARWNGSVRGYLDLYGIDDRDDFVRAHQVKLTRGFWMQETEVTRRQYHAVLGDDPSHWGKVGNPKIGIQHPVHSVSWADAHRFCEMLGEMLGEKQRVSLPTEAQWEYACRAGTDQLRFENLDKTSWHTENTTDGEASTGPRRVASKAPNPWGIYDMLGNMEEWCVDWYGPYPASTVEDPVGPDSGEKRVVRGRSHEDSGELRDPMDMRYGFHAADRYGKRPDARPELKRYAFKTVGFRIVLSGPNDTDEQRK